MVALNLSGFLDAIDKKSAPEDSCHPIASVSDSPNDNDQAALLRQLIDAVVRLQATIDQLGKTNNVTVNFGGTIMGDIIKGITDSTVVNRSSLLNSMNSTSGSTADLKEILAQIGDIINSSGNTEARELYETFVEEVAKPEPRRSVLRTVWQGIETALPAIKTATDIAGSISKLLT